MSMQKAYQPRSLEPKWQKEWEKSGVYRQYSRKKKFYVLDMFPYPSGAGLHVGHPKGYIATDVLARMKQLQGYSVLHPMGWDAFGLPAEQYALKNKVHPAVAVKKNIATFKSQLAKIGFTYDWEREINTTDPLYYKWTQWIFLQMWKKGLAYQSFDPINWCPSCQTGLANEDLEQGRCERCDSVVEKKPMRQWVLRMTRYADRLLRDLDTEKLEWSESIKEQQRSWIGRSEGAEAIFCVADSEEEIYVYTTRLDTIFGCTYVVIAPENPLIKNLEGKIENLSEVKKYIKKAASKSDLERTELAKEKTGVKLEGIEAINPFTAEKVPVYVADYVLGSYGTGAVMAVPAHDERDFVFAKRYDLPIKMTIWSAVKKHIVLIHGKGGPEDYLPWLKKKLENKGYEVETPILPNPAKPNDEEQTEYVIKNCRIDENTTVLGHSFGGVVALRALERGCKAGRVILAGMPFRGTFLDGKERPTVTAALVKGFQFEKIKKQAREFVLLYDMGDQVIPVDDGKAYAKHLGVPVVLVKAEMSHFDGTEEPELLEVLIGESENLFVEDGILVDSGEFTGLTSAEAREKMAKWLKKEKLGKKKVNYKMRDWVFSRQRYWGEPIPLVHCGKCGVVPVPEKELPVKLPNVKSYEPTGTGESPLAAIASWVNVKCPLCGGKAKRETNTMPQWAGSSWYYLRFIDPQNTKALVEKKKEQKMMPVDVYVGGTEHATRHLLYARFWHKFLYDIRVVSGKEPFKKLVNQGLIVATDGRKMSKRWNNVINPDDVVEQFGADAFRLYEMFMGPFTQSIAWNTDGVVGTRRFLEKVWKLQNKLTTNNQQPTTEKRLESLLHRTIKKVTEDIEGFKFNTAVSALMILVNALEKESHISHITYQTSLILLSPFAPHIAEELWERMGNRQSIFLSQWPKWDTKKIVAETVAIAVQINGKVRTVLTVPAGSDEATVQALALADTKIIAHLDGKKIRKVIYVQDKILNLVAG